MIGEQLLGPLVIASGLFEGQFAPFDVSHPRGTFGLQIGVIQRKEQVVFFDMVTDVHREHGDLAVDFRPH